MHSFLLTILTDTCNCSKPTKASFWLGGFMQSVFNLLQNHQNLHSIIAAKP